MNVPEPIKKADRIIIGIDPGTNFMGYGILAVYGKAPRMLAMGVIDLHRMSDHYIRLARIPHKGQKIFVLNAPPQDID